MPGRQNRTDPAIPAIPEAGLRPFPRKINVHGTVRHGVVRQCLEQDVYTLALDQTANIERDRLAFRQSKFAPTRNFIAGVELPDINTVV